MYCSVGLVLLMLFAFTPTSIFGQDDPKKKKTFETLEASDISKQLQTFLANKDNNASKKFTEKFQEILDLNTGKVDYKKKESFTWILKAKKTLSKKQIADLQKEIQKALTGTILLQDGKMLAGKDAEDFAQNVKVAVNIVPLQVPPPDGKVEKQVAELEKEVKTLTDKLGKVTNQLNDAEKKLKQAIKTITTIGEGVKRNGVNIKVNGDGIKTNADDTKTNTDKIADFEKRIDELKKSGGSKQIVRELHFFHATMPCAPVTYSCMPMCCDPCGPAIMYPAMPPAMPCHNYVKVFEKSLAPYQKQLASAVSVNKALTTKLATTQKQLADVTNKLTLFQKEYALFVASVDDKGQQEPDLNKMLTEKLNATEKKLATVSAQLQRFQKDYLALVQRVGIAKDITQVRAELKSVMATKEKLQQFVAEQLKAVRQTDAAMNQRIADAEKVMAKVSSQLLDGIQTHTRLKAVLTKRMKHVEQERDSILTQLDATKEQINVLKTELRNVSTNTNTVDNADAPKLLGKLQKALQAKALLETQLFEQNDRLEVSRFELTQQLRDMEQEVQSWNLQAVFNRQKELKQQMLAELRNTQQKNRELTARLLAAEKNVHKVEVTLQQILQETTTAELSGTSDSGVYLAVAQKSLRQINDNLQEAAQQAFGVLTK